MQCFLASGQLGNAWYNHVVRGKYSCTGEHHAEQWRRREGAYPGARRRRYIGHQSCQYQLRYHGLPHYYAHATASSGRNRRGRLQQSHHQQRRSWSLHLQVDHRIASRRMNTQQRRNNFGSADHGGCIHLHSHGHGYKRLHGIAGLHGDDRCSRHRHSRVHPHAF